MIVSKHRAKFEVNQFGNRWEILHNFKKNTFEISGTIFPSEYFFNIPLYLHASSCKSRYIAKIFQKKFLSTAYFLGHPKIKGPLMPLFEIYATWRYLFRSTLGWTLRWEWGRWPRALFRGPIVSGIWASSRNTQGKPPRPPVGPGDIACWRTQRCTSTMTPTPRRRSAWRVCTASGCTAVRPVPAAGSTLSSYNRWIPRREAISSPPRRRWRRNGE